MVEKIVYKTIVACPVCAKDDFYSVGLIQPHGRLNLDEDLEACLNCHVVRISQPKFIAP